MTDAPKTIWVEIDRHARITGQPEAHIQPVDKVKDAFTEYTLTSSIAAQLKAADELAEAMVQCCEEIDDYIRQEYPHDHPVQERCRQRDFSANPARIAITAYRKAKDEAQ